MTTIDIRNVSEILTILIANTTASGIQLADLSGATISGYAGIGGADYYPLSEYFSFSTINDSEEISPLVANGTFVINDGIRDLTASEGLQHIRYATAFEAGVIYENQVGATSFLDLADTPATYSGSEGKYLVATASGTEFVTASGVPHDHDDRYYTEEEVNTISGSLQDQIDLNTGPGIGTIKHYQFLFYHDDSHPHAIVEGSVYAVLTQMIFLGTNSTSVNTIKLAISGESEKDEADGSMQIYDLTNNNEIIEFGWSDLWENEWEVITVSGMNNLPAEEAIFELRTKSTNGKKSYLTHMFIY